VKYQRPKGTKDFLPEEARKASYVEEVFRQTCALFGFQEIRTPILEPKELFLRATGAETEIVQKEMYLFFDRSGRELALRPEGTPGVIRAVIEGGLNPPQRLFYLGPMFRYEKPQKGRFRQHHQLGIEVLGEKGPYTDAEVLFLATTFLSAIGIKDYQILLNSLGCQNCSPAFSQALKAFLSSEEKKLCPDCQGRLLRNPLRILDCKNENCQKIYQFGPKIKDYLCSDCSEHFASFLSYLPQLGIKNYRLAENLVRGIDYYTRTVFEFVSERLGSQNSFGGGGRYDNLFADLGGEKTPAIGFALGLERILMLLPEGEKEEPAIIFIAFLSPADFEKGKEIITTLRSARLKVIVGEVGERLKGQLKRANSYQARWVVIVGEEELKKGAVSVKDMKTGEQREIRKEELLNFLK
jgi:histidyl-tRNA synthetase